MPKISVLVPCFNDAPFLDEALSSIAGQSFADFEVIVSDDGSQDRSPEIAGSWERRDPRFRLIRNEHNLGMTENWNRCLREARGEWVAKLDADDVWRPLTLATLYSRAEQSPDPWLAFCRCEVLDTNLERSVGPWHGDAGLQRAGVDPGADALLPCRPLWRVSVEGYQLWHSNAFLVRRADLERLGGFEECWSCASDTALFLRLLAQDRAVAHCAYVGVLYRRRPGSVSDTFDREGWKLAETQLVRLAALSRDARRLRPWPRSVRQAWWESWTSWSRIASDADLWASMPPRVRNKLRAVVSRTQPPPLPIRLEGWARLQGWRVKHQRTESRPPEGTQA